MLSFMTDVCDCAIHANVVPCVPGPRYTYRAATTTTEHSSARATYNYSGTTGGRSSRYTTNARRDAYYAQYDNSNSNAAGSSSVGGLSEDEQLLRATQESILTGEPSVRHTGEPSDR